MWRKACNNSACLEADGPWVNASNPSGNCVEAAWTTACESAACVATSDLSDGFIRVRDTKQGETGPVLVYPIGTWDDGQVIDFIEATGTDQYMVIGVTEAGEQAALFFTQGEVDRFLDGIKRDVFTLAGR